MECEIHINEVEKFVTSQLFKEFILDNNIDIGVPIFILQTLLEKIDEIKKEDA